MDIEQDLNEEYVRVVNFTGEDIQGRYDGKDYVFPDGEYKDVKRVVAHHILGFMNPDKDAALLRLGWLGGSRGLGMREALELLSLVQFHEVPPFPKSVSEFKRPQKIESAARVGPTSTLVGQGEGSAPVASALPKTQKKA